MWATAAEEWLEGHRRGAKATHTPVDDYAYAVEKKLMGLRTDIVNGTGPGHGFRESQWDPEPGQEGWEEYEAAYYAAHPDAPRLDGVEDEDGDGMDGVEHSQDTGAGRSTLSQALHRLADAHDAQDAGSASTTTRLERSRNQRDFLAQLYERAEEARRTR
ncbi:hypothetical protein M8818_007307 [Zalaria obscura]|uniref:Uncharacterized protein n=1 Tax=Zalaria obscura TaxID=2024903 RepID=A0ACC3S3Y5_9PEZI